MPATAPGCSPSRGVQQPPHEQSNDSSVSHANDAFRLPHVLRPHLELHTSPLAERKRPSTDGISIMSKASAAHGAGSAAVVAWERTDGGIVKALSELCARNACVKRQGDIPLEEAVWWLAS